MNKNKSKKKINKQQKLACVSKPIFANLPRDLVPEILSLLPVKSLARFKCVCKSWRNLISSPKFIKTHLQKSNLSKNKLIFSYWSARCRFLVKSLSLDINDKSNAVSLDFPIENYRTVAFTIVGSCNGLVCLAVNCAGFLIWNPSTGLSNKLPHFSSRYLDRKFNLYNCSCCGFGYDPLNDDYKVVFMDFDAGFRLEDILMRVYSKKSNSWKIIRDFPHDGNLFLSRGEYFNGVIHYKLGGSSKIIITLNLGNETWGKIQQPDFGDRKYTEIQLSTLERRLSLFCHFLVPDTKTDVWIMEEYGVRETWTKLYTIQFSHCMDFTEYFFLICISTTGEMLFNSSGDLVLYNPAMGTFRNPKIGNLSSTLARLRVFGYVESLVSPQH